jgi:Protein involved in initiation of plasmid replication
MKYIEKVYSEIENKYDYKKNLVVMSNQLARKSTLFNALEHKIFLTALSQINNIDNEGFVQINKTEIHRLLDVDHRNMKKIRDNLDNLMYKSMIKFGNDEEFIDGMLITKVKTDRSNFYIKFDEDYMPLLIDLKGQFTMYHLMNVVKFKSKFSIALFQYLRSQFTGEYLIQRIRITTKSLKELFGLSEIEYMNKTSGEFDRANFEKKTIRLAIKEINETSECRMTIEEFKKNYLNRRVHTYEIAYSLKNSEGHRTTDQFEDVLPYEQLNFDDMIEI